MIVSISEIVELIKRIESGWRPVGDYLCIRCSGDCTFDVYTALLLSHIVHLFRWVGVAQGGVCRVVVSHDPRTKEGDVIQI